MNMLAVMPLFFVAILLVAVALLIFGLRGRRVGDEPRCRKCSYNLTAAVSDKCPECGIELDRTTVCWGLRRRRYAVLLLAFVLIAGEAAYLKVTYNRATWLRYYPYSLLLTLSKAQNFDFEVFNEMSRRHRSEELTPEQISHTIEVGLAYREAKQNPNSASSLEAMLLVLYAQLWFNDDQELRFHGALSQTCIPDNQ